MNNKELILKETQRSNVVVAKEDNPLSVDAILLILLVLNRAAENSTGAIAIKSGDLPYDQKRLQEALKTALSFPLTLYLEEEGRKRKGIHQYMYFTSTHKPLSNSKALLLITPNPVLLTGELAHMSTIALEYLSMVKLGQLSNTNERITVQELEQAGK